MIDAYARALAHELAAHGVPRREARRFVTEAAGHLHDAAARDGEDAAVAAFGAAADLAAVLAADLATSRARWGAYRAFLALAPAGLGYAVLFLTFPGGAARSVSGIAALAVVGAILFPQLAFVGGVLGVLRARRLRHDATLGAGDVAVVRTRTALALSAGVLTLVSLTALGLDRRAAVPAWWLALSLALLVAIVPALVRVGVAMVAARRLAVSGAPPTGTAVDDLGAVLAEVPGLRGLRLPADPFAFALLVAGLVAVAVAASGALAGDPLDGLLRAGTEALGVLGGYALLGRRLGLRV